MRKPPPKTYSGRNCQPFATTIPPESIDFALGELTQTTVWADGRTAHYRWYDPSQGYPDYGHDAVRAAYLAGYMDGAAGRWEPDRG